MIVQEPIQVRNNMISDNCQMKYFRGDTFQFVLNSHRLSFGIVSIIMNTTMLYFWLRDYTPKVMIEHLFRLKFAQFNHCLTPAYKVLLLIFT